MMVLLVDFEVLSQLGDTLTQKCYLDLWRTGITAVLLIIANNLALSIFSQRHILQNSSSTNEGVNVAENLFEVYLTLAGNSPFAAPPEGARDPGNLDSRGSASNSTWMELLFENSMPRMDVAIRQGLFYRGVRTTLSSSSRVGRPICLYQLIDGQMRVLLSGGQTFVAQ